jgi:hypothetical protein
MPTPAPSSLDSTTLAARLRDLAGEEREVQVEFLLHLDEFERRRAYLEVGHGSLWTYCLEVLHLREGPAGRRIQAMRVLRRFPTLEAPLRDGRLCLTTIALLGPVLTDENLEDLLARAAYRTRAEVDHLVASVQPRIAPKQGIRKLPDPAPAKNPLTFTGTEPPGDDGSTAVLAPCTPAEASAPSQPLSPDPAATDSDAPSRNDAPARRRARTADLDAISGSEWSLRVTIDASLKADVEMLRSLLSHRIPDGDLRAVLREAVRCAIEKHGKRRGTVAPSRVRKQAQAPACAPEQAPAANGPIGATDPSERRSRPTAKVRRDVTARDGASCSWVGPDGKRCGSTWQLEFDHVVPAALGGEASAGNGRIRCRAHNLLHAEQVFGKELMNRFRRSSGDRRNTG